MAVQILAIIYKMQLVKRLWWNSETFVCIFDQVSLDSHDLQALTVSRPKIQSPLVIHTIMLVSLVIPFSNFLGADYFDTSIREEISVESWLQQLVAEARYTFFQGQKPTAATVPKSEDITSLDIFLAVLTAAGIFQR